ncbi:hypothetical protein GII36_02145 [Candidatus Mycosynbacter amalyticus]|uniref:Uncharacterized protein n=1 Tax=Candidatus Mycosynbacter amalyticus TaxID=2665156 RepID=A0A857MMZ7_9BACT|nr:hypothetical protein [Candidatus Mycosynbacter amalyticus]QHN42649.1 hypothetical protein GII36_02145 [Candidatus Mycosynbacter amalyticus]
MSSEMHQEFNDENTPIIEPAKKGFEYVADLTNRQLELFNEALVEYTDTPSVKNDEVLVSLVTSHADSVQRTLEAYGAEFGDGIAAFRAMTYYVVGLEQRRVEMMNSLGLEGAEFKVINNGDVEGVLYVAPEYDDTDTTASVEPSEVVETVHSFYMGRFGADLKTLHDAAHATYDNSPRGRRKKYMRHVGSYALDVTKVAVGVVGAIAIAKKTKLL